VSFSDASEKRSAHLHVLLYALGIPHWLLHGASGSFAAFFSPSERAFVREVTSLVRVREWLERLDF
jgi:hypothetical protein